MFNSNWRNLKIEHARAFVEKSLPDRASTASKMLYRINVRLAIAVTQPS